MKQLTEPELIKKIDAARTNARLFEIEADSCDTKADVLFRHAPEKRETATEFRERAKKLRKRAASLCDLTIPRLSRRLAAVRTMPLAAPVGGGGGDGVVVAQ